METNASDYYGVILAAGMGSRIQPLSFDTPKPLLPVCNKPIMQYQIEYMKAIGISKFVIVVHHLKDKIIKYFEDRPSPDVHITFVEQKQPLGIAHAVAALERYVDAPFFLFLGDIFVVTEQLGRVLDLHRSTKAAAFLAVKKEQNPEYIKRNFAVILNNYGFVQRVIEKPRYVNTDLKGCGVYFFDLSIFDAVRRTPRTAMRDEYELTSAIQILIEDGCPVLPAEVIRWDMNVTNPEDLLLCNLEQLKSMGEKYVLGEHCHVHSHATIVNSIIGDNVTIEHPITIVDSLVLPHSVVTSRCDIRHAVISPGQEYNGDGKPEPCHAI